MLIKQNKKQQNLKITYIFISPRMLYYYCYVQEEIMLTTHSGYNQIGNVAGHLKYYVARFCDVTHFYSSLFHLRM